MKKILFCGLGSIGQRHLRNLIEINNNIKLSYLYHSKRNKFVLNKNNKILKRKNLFDFYSFDMSFDNINDAIKYDPDIVFITNPTSLHVDYALKFYNSKRIIFIEKPISHSSFKLKKLYNLDKKQKRSYIYSGMQFRFNPLIKKTKSIIESGLIGSINSGIFMNCEYLPDWHKYEDYKNSYASKKNLGGGSILTQIHELDYVTWIFGRPKSVYCIGGKNSPLKIDVEDSVNTHLFYNKKTKFNLSIIQNYITSPPKREFIILGNEGSIECDLISNVMKLKIKGKNQIIYKPNFDRDDLFKKQIRDLFSFYKNGNNQLIKIYDSYQLIKLTEDIKKSIKMNKVVKLK